MNITLSQFCAITGFSKQTVRQWVRDEQIEAVKISGKYVISEDELKRYKAEGLKAPKAKGAQNE